MTYELYHYGTPTHSGRYPYGSGERPFQNDTNAAKAKKAITIGASALGTLFMGGLASFAVHLVTQDPRISAVAGLGASIIPGLMTYNTIKTPVEMFDYLNPWNGDLDGTYFRDQQQRDMFTRQMIRDANMGASLSLSGGANPFMFGA